MGTCASCPVQEWEPQCAVKACRLQEREQQDGLEECEKQDQPSEKSAEMQTPGREEAAKKVEARRRYLEADGLLDTLRSGDIRLLRASWLLRRAGYCEKEVSEGFGGQRTIWQWQGGRGKPLPRRQDLEAEEPDAYMPFDELASMCKACSDRTRDWALPVVAVSYCWETADHPDPMGRLCKAVAELLAGGPDGVYLLADGDRDRPMTELDGFGYRDVGVFVDWSSVFQKPRSQTQDEAFKRALKGMNMLYAHRLAYAFIMKGQDEHLSLPRAERGWPFFEEAMCWLLKDTNAGHRKLFGGVQEPPLPSADFSSHLGQLTFTNGADRDMVAKLYRSALQDAFAGLTVLKLAGLGWDSAQLETTSRVLLEVGCTSLEEINLDKSQLALDNSGAEALLEVWRRNSSTLQHLSLQQCSKVRRLPEDLPELTALRELNLNETPLQGLTAGIGKLTALEILDLSYTDLQELPDSIAKLGSMKQLRLIGCRGLRRMTKTFGTLEALELLDLNRCSALEELPDDIGQLRALKSLHLVDCVSLRHLPKALGPLPALELLDLRGCSALEKLSADIGQLRALKSLNLKYCGSLRRLTGALAPLPALEILDLDFCLALVELPADVGQLPALKSLSLRDCRLLGRLPEALGPLPALELLDLRGCMSIRKLPADIGQLPALKSLLLEGCVSLRRLPGALGSLQALELLDLCGCSALEELPADVGQLRALRSLRMQGCATLRCLPGALAPLPALELLDLCGCSALEELPADVGQLHSLKSLILNGCASLRCLPKALVPLPALELLELRGCSTLGKLSADIGQLRALKSLILNGCASLRCLPRALAPLPALELFDLRRCRALQKLPADIGQLNSLKCLELSLCDHLRCLPESVAQLASLQELWLTTSKARDLLGPLEPFFEETKHDVEDGESKTAHSLRRAPSTAGLCLGGCLPEKATIRGEP